MKQKLFWKQIVKLFIYAVLLAGAVLFIYGVALVCQLLAPNNDGTSNFSGAQKELALKAVNDTKSLIDNKMRWWYSFYVKEVRPTTANEIKDYCTPNDGVASSSPTNPRFYTAVVVTGEKISLLKKTVIIDGCNAFGPNMDAFYFRR